MEDLIYRQQAIDALETAKTVKAENGELYIAKINAQMKLEILPPAQSEIIHCKDCKWWDKYSDTRGYCLAAKHGYWSKHWEISIRRTYDADWYCADAERREDGH